MQALTSYDVSSIVYVMTINREAGRPAAKSADALPKFRVIPEVQPIGSLALWR